LASAGCSLESSRVWRLSTLAIESSSALPEARRAPRALRYADLALLALALPVFVLAGFPLLGYAVGGGAWLLARAIGAAADRRAARVLAGGDRRAALGTVAAAMLGRIWLVALAVLLVGLLADREDGLAAAVLAAGLITAYLAGRVLTRIFEPPEGAR
jgi:hypothetical protein